MDLSSMFVFGTPPAEAIQNYYNPLLVALSYVIAAFASFVALDITERIRSSDGFGRSKIWWLILGSLAMGTGIWTMHFIGMLAFIMPMPMSYDPIITVASLLVAVVASGLAFFLIKNRENTPLQLMVGGVFMALGIVCMHYTGMAAMSNVTIQYYPGLFSLSILIAIIASEAALWLMIKGSKKDTQYPRLIKIGSALVMGLAICGMHYTGMSAAVFTHMEDPSLTIQHEGHFARFISNLSPDVLSAYIAGMTILILAIALTASKSWSSALQLQNQKLKEIEDDLQKKSVELRTLAENAVAREEKIQMILAAAADGIIVIDDQGIIEICNQAATFIMGYPASEMVSKAITSYIVLPVDLKNHTFHGVTLSKLFEKMHAVQQLYVANKQNEYIPIELTLSQSSSNNKTTYIMVFRDITQRKLSEERVAALNKELVSTARIVGMAEVANSVLHNIGNVLTSVNTSVQILIERDEEFKIDGIVEFSQLLERNTNNLEHFLKEDRIGKALPQYLDRFAKYLVNERGKYRSELDSLNSKVSHIKKIVMMQQSLSKSSNMLEPTDITQVLEEALTINSDNIEKFKINVQTDYANLPQLVIDKVKIIQILVNLIKNAVDILMEKTDSQRTITLRTRQDSANNAQIEVIDNGKGILPEDLTKIFSYGFTTKKDGHGFGLHASALSAQEVGGTLKAYSEGKDKGTKFVLTLPLPALQTTEKSGTHAN